MAYIIVGAFVFMLATVVIVLVAGLFFPQVDNKDVFPILKELIGTITGALIVLLTQALGKSSN